MADLNSSNKKWASMSDSQKKDIQDALSRVRGGGSSNETPQQALQRINSQGYYTPKSAFEMSTNPYTGETYDRSETLKNYMSSVSQAQSDARQLAMNNYVRNLNQGRNAYNAVQNILQQNEERKNREAALQRLLSTLPRSEISSGNRANAVTEVLAKADNTRNGLSYGFTKGLGYNSLVNAIGSAYENATGESQPSLRAFNEETERAQRNAPNAFSAGNIAGNIALMSGVGSAAGAGLNALGATGRAARLAANALTFGGTEAIHGLGDVAQGNISPGRYAKNIGTSALGGVVGGEASNLVGTRMADLLLKKGMMTPFMEFVRQTASGTAFGAGNLAATQAVAYGTNDDEMKLNRRQAAEQLATTFGFSMINGAIRTLNATAAAKSALQSQVDQATAVYEQLTNGTFSEEEYIQRINTLMEFTDDLRKSINSQYLAGNQAAVNNMNDALDVIQESLRGKLSGIDAARAAGNVGNNILVDNIDPGVDATGNVIPPVNGPESPTDNQLRALAEQTVDIKEAQRQALYEAGKNQEQNIQPLMDSSTMLSEEEKIAAVRQGNQDAANAQIEAIKAEIPKRVGKSRAITVDTPIEQRKTILVDYVKRVLSGAKTKLFEIVDPKLEGKLAEEITDAVGFDVDGYEVRLSRSEITHIDKRHGNKEFTDPEKLGFLTDLARLDGTVKLTDQVDQHYKNTDGTPAKKIKIETALDDGTYRVIEAVPDNKDKAIYIKSAYQIKKATSEEVDVTSPGPTSDNELQQFGRLDGQTLHPSEVALPEAQTIGSVVEESVSTDSRSNVPSTVTNSSINNLPSESQSVKENLNVRAEQTGADSLRGRSIRVLSQRAGEQAGRIPEAAGGTGEAGQARAYADPEAEVLRIGKEIQGEEVVRTAVPGQKVYLVEGDTKATLEAKSIANAAGVKATLYASDDGTLKVGNGERFVQSRGSYDEANDSIGVCVNNSRATASQIMKHEFVERAIKRGEVKVDELYNKVKEYDSLVASDIDDIVELYVMLSKEPTDTAHAMKEFFCDAGGGINQFSDVEGWEDVAATIDGVIGEISPMLNESLGGALDAKPELTVPVEATAPDPIATFSEQNNSKVVDYSIDQISQATGYQLVRNSEGVPYTLVDPATGKEVRPKDITPDKIRNSPQGRMIAASEKNGIIDAKTADAQRKFTADIMKMIVKYKDQATVWEISGSTAFSSFKANSDSQYGSTVDFGTICSKTQPIVDTMSNAMVEKGRGLKRDEVLKVYDAVAKTGLSVPCPVCYVFSRWVGVPSLLETMRRGQERFGENTTADAVNSYIKRMESTYNGKEGINNAKVKAQGKVQKLQNDLLKARGNDKEIGRIAKEARSVEKELADLEIYNWVTQVRCKTDSKRNPIRDKNGMVTLDPKYKSVPNDILLNLNRTGEFARDYPKQWLYRTTRGAGMGKAILPYSGAGLGDAVRGAGIAKPSQYAKGQNPFFNGDEKKAVRDIANARKRMRAQNLIGGQRLQSTSDFRAEWGIDYIVDMMEMQNVGAKGQLYTKVLEAVDLLATAGNEVNISAMGKGDGYHYDSKGRPVLGLDDFSNVTGVDIRAALQYVKKYNNAQIILVGLNDTHTRLALADDRIGFVIPWHASGSSEDVLRQLMASNNEELKNGTDYTPVQDDHVIDYGDKEMNAEKKSMRDLRKAIVMGKLKKGVSSEQQALLDKNEWLQDLYNRYYVDENAEEYGVKLSGKQAEKIFPYEYWDKSLTVKDADQNGLRFQEYCASLGLKPRFSGAVVDGKEIGNFANDPGYWKLLIDRSMYNLDGTYHEPQVIDVTKIRIDQVPMTVNSNLYRDDSKLKQATMDSLKALDERPNDVEMSMDISDSEISEDAVDYSTELDIPERDSSWLDGLLIEEILAELNKNVNSEPSNPTKTISEDTGLRANKRTDRVKARLHDLGLEYNGSKKIGWTSDRIDTYLDGHHFASSNPNYAQAYIAYISPNDYLGLTLGSNENTINRIEEETSMMGDLDLSKLDKDYLQPMFLSIMDEKETRANVAGHEGRHRMLLLGKAGFERVPVLVFNSGNKYDKHFKPALTLKPENQTGGFISKTREVTLHDVIPFSQGNRDIIMDTFGPDANDISYSTALNIEGMTPEEIDAAYKEKFAKHRKELEERRRQRRDIRKARVELLKKANKAVKLSKNRPGYAAEAVKDLVKDLDLVAVGMRKATKDKLREKYFEILKMRQEDPNYAALHSEKDMRKVERLFKKQIKDMDIDDVRDLITELSALIHYQETQNKLFKDSKNRTAAEAGRQWVKDLQELKPLNITSGVKQLGAKYLRNNLSPERAVRMISGYKRGSVASELVRNIEDGLTKQKEFEQKADQLFRPFLEDKANADFVKNASKQTIRIEDADGNSAMISPAMRVALYMHSKNTDNLKHIASGGVTIPDPRLYEQGKYYDAYDRGVTLKLDPTEIENIIADTTPSETDYAGLLGTFFDTYSKDAINEASMTLDGIFKAVVDNYFPITSDKNFLAKAMDLTNDPTLEGWNNLKARQEGSSNPIMLEDVTKVLQRHITKTGQYYGLAVPLRDFQKVYGYTSSGYETSVQKAIGKTWDADTKKYLEQWITDLNTGGRQAEKGILDTMRGVYAGSVLTLNPSVALKQTTSYSMAGSILDFGSLMYGLGHRFTKADQAYMDSITPWGWARRQGQSTIELGDLAKQKQSLANKIPNWNQAMDVWTTNRLFLATEKSIQNEYPNLQRGDKEYDEALAERYNQVLWRTQPQYEAMFRPEYLRKTDIGSRTFGMFKTESMQMSGELIDALGQWRADSERAKDGTDENKRAKSESARHFYKTMASWLASNMMFAIFGSTISIALMHKGKQYRDEKGEITLDSIAKQTAKQFGSSVFGGMFALGNAYDVGQYLYDVIHKGNGNWYDIEAPGFSLINDAINNAGTMIGTLMNEESNAEARRKSIAKFAMSISKFTPIGFSENLYNMLNSVNLYIQDASQGSLGRYEAGKGLLADTSPDKAQYANMAVSAATKGDTRTLDRALENTNKAALEKAIGAEDKYDDAGEKIDGSKKQDGIEKVMALKTSDANKAKILDILYPTKGLDAWKGLGGDAYTYYKYGVDKISEDRIGVLESEGLDVRKFTEYVSGKKTPALNDAPNQGFDSYDKLRTAYGPGARNENLHHIVEQEQSETEGLAGFASSKVQNFNNIVSIPSGTNSVHADISRYYTSKQDFTNGKTVREWLAGKSFEEQWEFGIKKLEEYGKVVPTEKGWAFIPDADKIEDKIPTKPETIANKYDIDLDTVKEFDSKISDAKADGMLSDNEIRGVALEMMMQGVNAEDAYDLYMSKNRNDTAAVTWVESGNSFKDYLSGATAMSEAKEIKDADAKRQKVVEYLDGFDGSDAEKQALWKIAGYGESTYNQYNVPGSEEYKKAEESAKKKAEKEADEKARGITEETKAIAKEIDAKIPEDTDKYLFVSQSKEWTPEQKVEWFKSDSQRTDGKKYKAWKNAGGVDYDYIKYRGDISRYDGLPKKEKKSKVTEYINSTGLNAEKKRVLWTFAGYKESTCPW